MRYGYQGGDPDRQHRHQLDLSGCVNRYGPPQSVLRKLKEIGGDVLKVHPYIAADQVRKAYSSCLNGSIVSPGELLVGRGTSEFIARLPFVFKQRQLNILFPFYTDFVRVMEANNSSYEVLFPKKSGEDHKFNVIKEALECGNSVIMANPCNPSGEYISRDLIKKLAAVAENNGSILVVDESYIEFSKLTGSVLGANSTALVVLQSTAKFYGLAATRVGILWTRNDSLRAAFGQGQPNWPVSGVDALLAEVALRDHSFKLRSVEKMSRDLERLKNYFLDKGIGLTCDSVTNFVLLTGNDAKKVIHGARRFNIALRSFGSAHRFPGPAARVAAPRYDEFDIFTRCMNRVL